jgi:hypothetical protein
LLEDAILIYRIQRAPERRVFKIDVGNMPSHMAMAFVERVKNEIHQRRIPSQTGGGANVIDSAYNPLCLDLYTKIPFDEQEVKEIAASKGTPAGSGKTKTRVRSGANAAWKDFRSSLGIKHGSQLLPVLGGSNPENMKFLSSLGQMSADDAMSALAAKGVNLDDPATLAKVTGAPVVNESLAESQQQLDRIKQLIKY